MPKQTAVPKIALSTLGCKVNQYESAAFLSELTAQGIEPVPFDGSAEVYVINTCAVTARAGAQSRQLIRRALRSNPKARLVVTGCYAELAAEEIRALAGPETPTPQIVGNGFKQHLLEAALAAEPPSPPDRFLGQIAEQQEICPLFATGFAERSRSYLKVQDGCNSFCSYCIVPHTRGRSRSLAPDQVLAQAEAFAEQGFREQVLTGIHLGYYGRDLKPPSSLVALIRLLLDRGLPGRYRLSSLEPSEIDDALLKLMADAEALTPYLHIPLQSGDDTILARMNRKYPAALFVEVVEKAFARLPDLAVGVDVLAGFPGEDASAFENTFRLLASLPIASLHVFPYSKRPGTPAAEMPDQVAAAVKKERVARLRELDQIKRQAFYTRHLGSVRPVLVEGGSRSGLQRGFTDNYIPVVFRSEEPLARQMVELRLEKIENGAVLGSLQQK